VFIDRRKEDIRIDCLARRLVSSLCGMVVADLTEGTSTDDEDIASKLEVKSSNGNYWPSNINYRGRRPLPKTRRARSQHPISDRRLHQNAAKVASIHRLPSVHNVLDEEKQSCAQPKLCPQPSQIPYQHAEETTQCSNKLLTTPHHNRSGPLKIILVAAPRSQHWPVKGNCKEAHRAGRPASKERKRRDLHLTIYQKLHHPI
jgi:hypothetical protein